MTAVAAQTPVSGEGPIDVKSARLLVVEDNRHAMRLITTVLRSMGVPQIESAHDGHEALKKINACMPFDLVICDRNMPEMNGIELLKKLRRFAPDLPFLMVTANADLESVQEARSLGATAFLAKPYTPKDLEARIHAIFNQQIGANPPA